MLDKFSNMFDTITGNGLIATILIIAAIAGVTAFCLWLRARRNKIPHTSRNRHSAAVRNVKARETVTKADKDLDDDETDGIAGEYPAYIVTLDGSLDFDYIPEPLGDVLVADTSMPKAGACYFVREVKKEGSNEISYEAYDPRTAPLLSEESPIKAWFATHWDIVKDVYGVAVAWWKSTSLWIAGLTGMAAFIVAIATVGA